MIRSTVFCRKNIHRADNASNHNGANITGLQSHVAVNIDRDIKEVLDQYNIESVEDVICFDIIQSRERNVIWALFVLRVDDSEQFRIHVKKFLCKDAKSDRKQYQLWICSEKSMESLENAFLGNKIFLFLEKISRPGFEPVWPSTFDFFIQSHKSDALTDCATQPTEYYCYKYWFHFV